MSIFTAERLLLNTQMAVACRVISNMTNVSGKKCYYEIKTSNNIRQVKASTFDRRPARIFIPLFKK